MHVSWPLFTKLSLHPEGSTDDEASIAMMCLRSELTILSITRPVQDVNTTTGLVEQKIVVVLSGHSTSSCKNVFFRKDN